MRYVIPLGASLALAVAVCPAVADDSLKSGPQKGGFIGGPFNPLNVTGANAGEKVCQV
jgi:hypothetical protein